MGGVIGGMHVVEGAMTFDGNTKVKGVDHGAKG